MGGERLVPCAFGADRIDEKLESPARNGGRVAAARDIANRASLHVLDLLAGYDDNYLNRLLFRWNESALATARATDRYLFGSRNVGQMG